MCVQAYKLSFTRLPLHPLPPPMGEVAERGAPRSESTIIMIAGGNHSKTYSEVGEGVVRQRDTLSVTPLACQLSQRESQGILQSCKVNDHLSEI